MTEHYVQPNPIEIAHRTSLATGEEYTNPYRPLSDDTVQEVYFDLADDRSAATAVVNLSLSSKRTRLNNDQMMPEWRGGTYAHIGHYDPAYQRWAFYPESVKPEERTTLGEMYDEMAAVRHKTLTVESEEQNYPYIDLSHPLTITARHEMAERIKQSGILATLLSRDVQRPNEQLELDESTTCTLVLTPTLSGPGIGPGSNPADRMAKHNPNQYGMTFDQTATISLRGLILRRDNTIKRAKHHIHVASRSLDDESVWIPKLDIISYDEWESLRTAPQQMLRYKQQNPGFSAEHCAVVHGYDH